MEIDPNNKLLIILQQGLLNIVYKEDLIIIQSELILPAYTYTKNFGYSVALSKFNTNNVL